MIRASRILASRAALAIAGTGWLSCASADVDEAWIQRSALPQGTQPVLAVVLDHSTATAATIPAREPFDAARDYAASAPAASRCDPSKAYFRRGPGPAPDCSQQAGIDLASRSLTGLQCEAARAALASAGFYVASRAAQWRTAPDGGYWGAPAGDSGDAVECRADRGVHGSAPGRWYASDGTGTPWVAAADREIDWDRPPFADAYIFYSGNFLNYLQSAAALERSIADLLTTTLAQSLAATDELTVALLRVDDDGPDGGYVARAPIANRLAAADVQVLAMTPPAGTAPLAETLAEAASWLQGAARQFGTDPRADPQALAPGGAYRSPFEHACRPVSLAFLTAGLTSDDDKGAAAADTLAHFNAETGGCGADCAGTLAVWLGATDLRDGLPGRQSAPVSWVAPVSIGDGHASPADPLAIPNVIADAFQRDAALAALPQLSAAALTAMGDEADAPGAILGLSVPRSRARWPGNLMRYALRAPSSALEPPVLVDREGEPAIDRATGLPFPGTQSLWSDVPDSDLLAGGADGRLPSPDARRVFTDVANARLLDADNRLAPGNPRISRAALGLAPTDPETLDDALSWPAALRTLGDPGIDAPLVVDYPASGRVVVYAATQDGLLHAFDAESGIELWSWMPKELLPRIPELRRDAESTVRIHGIDGRLVLHRYDPDGDGRVTAGEHLWLIFGLGRGGSRYYALDIAEPLDPRLAWSFALPDAGVQSLAEPVVSRLAISGSAQSAGDWVVLISGGYDLRFDARGAAGTGRGNALHVVDAVTGRELWSGGTSGTALPMTGLASLPSAPRALDFDGNGYVDRAYLLDVTGSLWRLDFSSGQPPATLATARRLARLGTGLQRFFATPDAVSVRIANQPRIALAAGSGWITRPRDGSIEDRFYVVYDVPGAPVLSDIADAQLFDATGAEDASPPAAPGWFVRLAAAGEKVAGAGVTFDHVLRFQTYQPLPPDEAAPCGPPRSVSHRYALDVRTARPREFAIDSEEDDSEETTAPGFPVDIRFGFPGQWDAGCEGCRPRPFGIAGGETFDAGYAGDPVRTSWRKLIPPPASP